MPKRPVRRIYDSLSPEEAFRVALSAAARGDKSEVEEILTHLPMGWIETRHPRFDRELDGTHALVGVAGPNLSRFIGWLQVLEAIFPFIGEAIYGSPTVTEPSGKCHPALLTCLFAGRVALRRLAGMVFALAEVSAAHNLDAADVLRAFMPELASELGARAEHIAEAGYEEEAMESFRAQLEEAWHQATT